MEAWRAKVGTSRRSPSRASAHARVASPPGCSVPARPELALPTLIGRLHGSGTVMASVCTGAMLLAAAGILKGRPAVTNHLALDDLRAAGARVQAGARVVDDGDVVTSGGPSAELDLAIHLVERYRGTDVADLAASRLEYERRHSTPARPPRQRGVGCSTR